MKRLAYVAILMVIFLVPTLQSPSPTGALTTPSPVVYTNGDETVEVTSRIQQAGNLYAVNPSLPGPLIVKSDNVVIDAAGASWGGIVIENRHGVIIKNAVITLDKGTIVKMRNTTDCALIDSTLIGNPGSYMGWVEPGPMAVDCSDCENLTLQNNMITTFYMGFSLEQCNGGTIVGNTLSSGLVGIWIENCSGCSFRDNRLTNCTFSVQTNDLYAYRYDNDLDASNTVDGKPIYYWVNRQGATVPSDAAYVMLASCKDITVANSSPQGICLVSTTNTTISQVSMVDSREGICLQHCSTINVVNCVLRHTGIGVRIENSQNNFVVGNQISSQLTGGIRLIKAPENMIFGNLFFNNTYGVGETGHGSSSSSGNTIAQNNFTLNERGIELPSNSTVNGNFFEGNEYAIRFYDSSGSIITQNTFIDNRVALHFTGEPSYSGAGNSSSSGNSIHHNNFLANDQQVTDAGIHPSSTQQTWASSHAGSVQLVSSRVRGVNIMPPPSPSVNSYDDGVEGNYWIDYNGSDGNGDGIGDTAYFLYEGNQDNHPLMHVVATQQVPSSPQDFPSVVNIPSPTAQPAARQDPREAILLVYVAMLAGAVFAVISGGLLYRKRHARKGKPLGDQL